MCASVSRREDVAGLLLAGRLHGRAYTVDGPRAGVCEAVGSCVAV